MLAIVDGTRWSCPFFHKQPVIIIVIIMVRPRCPTNYSDFSFCFGHSKKLLRQVFMQRHGNQSMHQNNHGNKSTSRPLFRNAFRVGVKCLSGLFGLFAPENGDAHAHAQETFKRCATMQVGKANQQQ